MRGRSSVAWWRIVRVQCSTAVALAAIAAPSDCAAFGPPAPLNVDAATDTRRDAAPTLATDGVGRWVAVWEATLDIMCARSTDGGATWSVPAKITNDPGAGQRLEWGPEVATDGAGTWLVAWYSAAGPTSIDQDILYSRSTDGGISWSAPGVLNSNAPSDAAGEHDLLPHLTAGANGVWIATWRSNASLGGTIGPDDDVLFARSADGGITWSAAAPLNTNAASDTGVDWNARLATDRQGRWVAIWQSNTKLPGTLGDLNIFGSRSSDDGLTWTAPQIVNSDASERRFRRDEDPMIATDGTGAWVSIWTSYAYDSWGEIVVSRSSNDGLTWTPMALVAPRSLERGDGRAHLVTDGVGMWVAVWMSRVITGAAAGGLDLLAAWSLDRGVTWSEPVSFADRASMAGWDPQIAGDSAGHWVSIWAGTGGSSAAPYGSDDDVFMVRAACGDGEADPGEECDDGGQVPSGCCTPACTAERVGLSCLHDDNPCTSSVCDERGRCGTPFADDTPCDDGLFCNGWDSCYEGICYHSGDPCADGWLCAATCDELADSCFDPAGTPCSDWNPCTDDQCDGAGACVAVPNAAPCDDGVFCNGPDHCRDAACSFHAGTPCPGTGECATRCEEATEQCTAVSTGCTDDGNPCTLDLCDLAGTCVHPPGYAGAVCRPAAGACDFAEACDGIHEDCPDDGFASDDTPCDDGDVCSVHDHCEAGVCLGELVSCGDGVQQTVCLEECDDGNRAADDGCDADCRLEPCRAIPRTECRGSIRSGAGVLKLKRRDPTMPSSLDWSLRAGAATSIADWGNPLATDSYSLCVYDDNVLRSVTTMPASVGCDSRACWRQRPTGFRFKGEGSGARLKLVTKAGADGYTSIRFRGRGLSAPSPEQVAGPLQVQLVTTGGDIERCWQATFKAPFLKSGPTEVRARAD